MKDISELMLDRLLEMQKRVIELEQKLAVVQEREAARDNPHVDQAEQHAQAAEAVAEAETNKPFTILGFPFIGDCLDELINDSVTKNSKAKEDNESLPEIPEGFIRHDGGECPVPFETKVIFFTRSQITSDCTWKAASIKWNHDGVLSDIIAYKVIEE